jgi:acetoin utilization protein AcuB
MAAGEQPRQVLKAGDIMTQNLSVVESSDTVQDAADVMLAVEVRHVPVVEQGELVGMVSDRDLRSYMLPRSEQIIQPAEARARLETNICMVMRTDPITVTTDTPVAEIVEIMLREKIGAVPVLQTASRRLLGMVSYLDVLRVARAFF